MIKGQRWRLKVKIHLEKLHHIVSKLYQGTNRVLQRDIMEFQKALNQVIIISTLTRLSSRLGKHSLSTLNQPNLEKEEKLDLYANSQICKLQ
jgi:hypothetical protein